MTHIGKIGIALIAIGLLVTAWPFVMSCDVMPGGRCGDGQALLMFPFLGLPLAGLGLLILTSSLIARLFRPAPTNQDEETEF